MWWHRDLAPAHTSRAATPPGGRDEYTVPPRTPARELPARRARATPCCCRAGCTGAASSRPSRSWSSATGPGWPRSWSRTAHVDVPPEETPVEVVGTATANPQAPGGVEVTYTARSPRWATRRTPRRSSCGDRGSTPGCPRCSTTRRRPGGTRASAPCGSWQRPACTASARPSTRAASPRSTPPKLVESATESGANVFEVDYFGRPAYLAQSPQFYKQVLVGVFERVYEVGPVFRAEPHDTVRHLAEYVSPRRRARLRRATTTR